MLEATPNEQRLSFGRCELRLDSRELHLAGVPQRVKRRVFDLLVLLVRSSPGVVSHGDLMKAVWQRTDVSQPVIARAIMQARRACGDDTDKPKLILTVHAVGYRFAGHVVEGAPVHPPAPDWDGPSPGTVDEVRRLVQSARRAIFEHRFDQARTLAETALARARELGVRSEQVRALLSCSLQALHCRQLAEAARLATHALQIARLEGFPQMIAEAGMQLGGLQVLAGDGAAGIRRLRKAMQVFSQPGQERNLRACMNWLARAMYHQGELEVSLQLCRRGIALQRSAAGPRTRQPVVDRLNEIQLLIELGHRDADAGLGASAHEWFRQALEAAQALLPALEDADLGVPRAACLSHQSVALERLDRLGEACAAAAACDAQRERLKASGSQWPDAQNAAAFRVRRARLLARSGRPQEALAELRDALLRAATAETTANLVNLYRTAADAAILAGDHKQASQWLRAHCDALGQTKRSRGASTAAMLAAELDVEALHGALTLARSESRELLTENARLRRRLQQLSGAAEPAGTMA